MTNEREPSDAAYKAMCQAHSLCPIDLPYLGRMRWMAARVEAALASQAQPVAWRYRYSKEGSWRFANESASKWAPNDRFEEEPLYAAPIAAGEPHTEVVPASSVQRLMGDLQKRSDECEGVLIHIHRDELRKLLAVASGVLTGAPGATDVERAAWLADKIGALGDYAKEAAAMLRRWPSGVALPRDDQQEQPR